MQNNGIDKNIADGEYKATGRRWVFTINHPQSDELWTVLPDGVRAICWQAEVGAQGTRHLQGYLELTGPQRRKRVSTILGGAAWVGFARGTQEQCLAYCTKQETRANGPWRLGEFSAGQGARSDLKPLQVAVQQIVAGAQLQQIDPYVFAKNANGLMKLMSIQPAPRRDALKIICIRGTSGIGKTFWAYERFPDLYRPNYGNGGLWWDGYAGQECVLLDEFRGQCPLQKLLMILDKYPLMLEVKGGYLPAKFTTVIITCNSDPTFWYPNAAVQNPEEFAALSRRIGMVHHEHTDSHYIVADTREYMRERIATIYGDNEPPVVVNEPSTDLVDDIVPDRPLHHGAIPPLDVPIPADDELQQYYGQLIAENDTVPLPDDQLDWEPGHFYNTNMCDTIP